MTISHPPRDMPGGAFVFARLADISCSVCAPSSMTKAEVERFAHNEVGPALGGWEAIDKSAIGWGEPTPNACNIDQQRKHWFLLDGMSAASLGYMTKK